MNFIVLTDEDVQWLKNHVAILLPQESRRRLHQLLTYYLRGTQPTLSTTTPPPESPSAMPPAFTSYTQLEDTLLRVRQALRNSGGSSVLNVHEAKGALNFSLEGTILIAPASPQELYEQNQRARS